MATRSLSQGNCSVATLGRQFPLSGETGSRSRFHQMKVFGLSVPLLAFANDAMGKHPAVLQGDVKELQESLRREGIRKYQKAENLQVTDMLIRRLQASSASDRNR